ncbi:MAG: carboxy-S-adenosyl-L-methionine synthase CmoA [Chitinophagaceae bacterium]
MPKDEVFKETIQRPSDFKFSKNVANVFDDMVNRSVPFYGEIQRMIAELASTYAKPGTELYDLGCSTGNSFLLLDPLLDPAVHFVGIDDSADMLYKCDEKLKAAHIKHSYELIAADINGNVHISKASVVILCLTLQFVRPLYREKLLQKIYDGLEPGGALILIEKILAEESDSNRQFIQYYYDYKRRQQYSEMEISQKREALENVLIPYKLSENIQMLGEAGFTHCEVFFKWYNFSGLIAIKN